jgi:hypothetical protein
MTKLASALNFASLAENLVFRKYAKIIAWLMLATVVGLYLSVLFRVGKKYYGGNPSGFMCIGFLGNAPEVHNSEMFIRPDAGYDSQFFYFIALNPLLPHPYSYLGHGMVDHYRYQRILYGTLAGILSGESPKLIPYALLGINLATVILGTWILMLLCDHFGVSRLFSVFYGLTVTNYLGFMRTTTEPLYLCMMLVGFYFYIVREDFPKSAVFLSLAVLSKEIALATVGGLLIYELVFQRRYRKAAWFFLPILTYVLMQSVIYAKFGRVSVEFTLPAVMDTGRMYPLKGLVDELRVEQTSGHSNMIPILMNILFAAVLIVGNLFQVGKFKHPFLFLGPIYLGLAHLASSAAPDMIDLWGYGRHTGEIFICLLFLYLYQRQKIFLLPLAANTICAGILLSKPFF